MVWRLEKTDRSNMFVGHDWMLSVSANGHVYSPQPNYNTREIPEMCSSHIPVISLTVLKIFSLSGSSGGTLL